MSQDIYALLKVSNPKQAKTLMSEFQYIDSFSEAFFVQNIKLPGVLLWLPVNYHSIFDNSFSDSFDDDSVDDLVMELILNCIPIEVLQANENPQGLLLFPDAGEPRTHWPTQESYESLIKLITTGKKGRDYLWLKPQP